MRVPLLLVEKVDQLAVRRERSRDSIMTQALSAWIEQEEERSHLTREAFSDVDTGHAVDHQTLQAWADRLSSDTPLSVPR
ncbi:CopG family ribbon-helix-helix protein [Glaciimonas sp. GG7]